MLVIYFLPFLILAIGANNTKKEEIFKLAVGPCISDKCQTGYSCYYGQCIPKNVAPKMPPMDPTLAVGPCINGMCPRNTFCHKEQCYPDQ